MFNEMLAMGSNGGGSNVRTGTGVSPSGTNYKEFVVETGLSNINHFALVDDAGKINLTYANSLQSAVANSSYIEGQPVDNTTSVYTMKIKSIASNGDIIISTSYYATTHDINYTWYAD